MSAFNYGIYTLTSASVFLSLIVFIIYSRNNFNRGILYKGISFLLLTLCFRFFTIHLYINHLIYDYPHFLLLNNLTSRIALPVLYFVILSSLYSWKIKWFDWLHLILPVLFVIHFYPILFGPADVKIELIKQMDERGYDIIWTKGVFESPYLINAMRYLTLYGYTFLIFTLLFWSRNYKRLPKHFYSFFKLTLVFILINLIPSFISHFGFDIWNYASMIGAASTLLLSISVFFVPDFLFPDLTEMAVATFYEGNQKDGMLSSNLVLESNTTKENQLFQKIELYFNQENPFLDPDFSLNHLEKHFGISGRYISEAIKECKSMSFPTYVNQARLDYLNENLAKQGELSRLTVDEIASEVGFRSVNSFYLFLRKAKNCTPKEYLESILEHS